MYASPWAMLTFSCVMLLLASQLNANPVVSRRNNGLNNMTIQVANGTYHSDDHILCPPATWATILIFLLGNFVAHAGSIVTSPGQGGQETRWNIFFALIYPNSGLIRGLDAVFSGAVLARNSLKQAARSGALYIVLNKGSRNIEHRESQWWCFSRESEDVLPSAYDNIHGACKPPAPSPTATGRINSDDFDYKIVVLPRSCEVMPLANLDPSELQLTSTSTIMQCFASIFQLLFAIHTLFKSQKILLKTYGCTAVTLTVVPYAVMSIINFAGNIITPGYPKRYLIRTEDMHEAESKGWRFEGVVGKLKSTVGEGGDGERFASPTEEGAMENMGKTPVAREGDMQPFATREHAIEGMAPSILPKEMTVGEVIPTVACQHKSPSTGRILDNVTLPAIKLLCTPLSYLGVSSAPFICMATMTGFQLGSTPKRQQVFIFLWFASNIAYGPLLVYMKYGTFEEMMMPIALYSIWGIEPFVLTVIFFFPPLAMFVVSGTQLYHYGDCISIGG